MHGQSICEDKHVMIFSEILNLSQNISQGHVDGIGRCCSAAGTIIIASRSDGLRLEEFIKDKYTNS